MNGGGFPGDQVSVYNPEPPVNGDKLFVALGQRRGRPRLRCRAASRQDSSSSEPTEIPHPFPHPPAAAAVVASPPGCLRVDDVLGALGRRPMTATSCVFVVVGGLLRRRAHQGVGAAARHEADVLRAARGAHGRLHAPLRLLHLRGRCV
eukprot:COSAG01_NODE_7903_length_2999_cov_3.954483_3_plen_149_part_00